MAGMVNTNYVSAMDNSYKDGIARPCIQIGQILWVADNSGVQKVEVSKHIIPSVYLVKVNSVRPGYERKIPIGTEFCGVLVRFADFGYYRSNQVCLFKTHHLLDNYMGGQAMFTQIYGGTIAPRNDLKDYNTILSACCLKEKDYVRVDLETYAQIQKINHLKKDFDGSEFEVKLTSGNRFFLKTGFKRDQIVNGVLRRRPFRTNVNTSSLLAYSFDVYQLDIVPLAK
jgi:hypothetical protein